MTDALTHNTQQKIVSNLLLMTAFYASHGKNTKREEYQLNVTAWFKYSFVIEMNITKTSSTRGTLPLH